MKSIIRFSMNNPFALWLLTIMVTVAGLYAGMNMKMETIPNINIPIVSITVVYPGATPQEVVEHVSVPIEQSTRNLQGVTAVSSSSFENAAYITVEYDYDKDMDEAEVEVREALSAIQLPEGAEQPNVSRMSLNAFPIMSLSVSGDQDFQELTRVTEERIVPELKTIPGVDSIQLSGQQVRKVMLTLDEERMAAYGLTEETVKGIIQGSALSAPLGIFYFEDAQRSVVVDGGIHTLEELQQMQIPIMSVENSLDVQNQERMPISSTEVQTPNTSLPTISLEDIANIEVVGEVESISRTNGQQSIGIAIVKSPDANTVEVVNNVKKAMTDLEQRIEGITLTPMFDQGKPIEDSVNTMLNKALLGSIFAIVIILFFLRNLRSTMIAVISIPLSILMALVVLQQMNITLNIMTLGAMTVAIGRVVDDSIVVIENIFRRMSLKTEQIKGKELIVEATKEMFIPISSSTIVTIAVFLPLGLVRGPVGEIFMPFALTIVFALLASLLVAVTLVPMMANLLFRTGLRKKQLHDKKVGRLAYGYQRALNWALNHKLISFSLALMLFAGSLFLVPMIGVSFLPSEGEKMMMITYNPAPGDKEENVLNMTLQAEKVLLERDGVQNLQYTVGGSNPMSPGATNQALFYVMYDDSYTGFEEEKEHVITLLEGLQGEGQWQHQDMTGGSMGGDQMSLLIYGPDMDTVKPVVEQVMEVMQEQNIYTNIDSSISESYEQYTLVANQAKLSEYGLTAGQVALELSPIRQNSSLLSVEQDGEDINVYIQVEEKSLASKEELENVTIQSPLGFSVPLKEVMEVQEGETPDTITRRDDRIYANVTASLKTDDVAAASSKLQQAIDKMELQSGVEISFGGVTEQINESFSQLAIAMVAAVAIVYFILVLTFGGALTPFAILFSLPFTVIGAFLGLFIAGETISVTSMIGFLMLIGIVVTNAIVFIDRVLHKQKEGLAVREALLEAAGTRLRPILMTAIATIGALIPLALGYESGGLISKGLGVTVIGGLISSTLLTLMIVPVVYEFLVNFLRRAEEKS